MPYIRCRCCSAITAGLAVTAGRIRQADDVDVPMEAMLIMMKECEEQGWASLDWEIASEVALFGMRSLTACPPRTNSWLLYRGGLENAAFLRGNRDKQRSAYASPRVSSPARYPRFEPEKMHPKSVETVTKADGTVI
eukprot:COSAG03_NODE_65_length_15137_cov_3.350446_2_plen_137_part_00